MGKRIVNVVNSFNDVVASLLVDAEVLEMDFSDLNMKDGEQLSEYLERLPFSYEEIESKTLYLTGTN